MRRFQIMTNISWHADKVVEGYPEKLFGKDKPRTLVILYFTKNLKFSNNANIKNFCDPVLQPPEVL